MIALGTFKKKNLWLSHLGAIKCEEMVFILVVFPQVKNSYTKQLALLGLFSGKMYQT